MQDEAKGQPDKCNRSNRNQGGGVNKRRDKQEEVRWIGLKVQKPSDQKVKSKQKNNPRNVKPRHLKSKRKKPNGKHPLAIHKTNEPKLIETG